jgi:hypothetical protein
LAHATSRLRLTARSRLRRVVITTIFESPPGTTPGPAPRTPRPWWKKPLTWIITGIAIVALGGASLAAYATLSGKTAVAPKPASTAPARPVPSSPPGASAPASQEQQLMSWFLTTGERHLKTIGSDESIVASHAQSLSNGNAADTSQLSADLARVRQSSLTKATDVLGVSASMQ